MALKYVSSWVLGHQYDVMEWSLIYSARDSEMMIIYYENLMEEQTSTSVFSTNMVDHKLKYHV